MYPYYQYNQMRPPMSTYLNGRMVTNIEEARAAQIDLDGSQWYFPCPSEGKVYSKSINMSGLPVFNTYVLTQPTYQEKDEKVSLAARVENLEKMVKELKENGLPANVKPSTEQSSDI